MTLVKRRRASQGLTSLILFALLILFISSCAKAGTSPASEPNSFDSQIAAIKEKAQNVDSGIESNESGFTEQVVILPLQQNQPIIGATDIFSPNYRVPCIVEKYKVLNKYCGMKTFWLQQSELTSWYVPYYIIFLILVIVIFILWMRRDK